MHNTTANDVIIGAAAGVVATVPMTLTMEALHRALPDEHHEPLPPREVTEGIYGNLGADSADEAELQRMTLLMHYMYGGAAGTLFPLLAPKRLPSAVAAGVLYGLAVWSASYLGLLPALRVRHHARHDSGGRTAMMIASHVVWGATLGLVLSGRPGIRAASSDPDAPAA